MNVLELKKFRSTQNLSREELAEAIGITIETLNTWEYRTKKIPNDKVERVKYVFNMYKYTYEGSDSKNVVNEPSVDYGKKEDRFIEYEGVKIPAKYFAMLAAENKEILMEEKVFSNIIELEAALRLVEITASAESLRAYLDMK